MKVICIDEYGDRSKLKITEQPDPQADEGEYVIAVAASGLNPVDWKIREGLLKDRMPNRFPIVLGWEMAGVVIERGYSARRFDIGDKVFAYCRRPEIHEGTYAQQIRLPESYVTTAPKGIPLVQAAAVPLAALTAYQSLFDAARLKPDESVLIVGASGGVGSFAVQMAKITGAKAAAVASPANHEYCRQLGAQWCFDYHEDFSAAVRKEFPEGMDVVFACAGGESLTRSYECVKKGGRLVTIVETGDPETAAAKGFLLHYVFVQPHVPQLEQIRSWIEEGRMTVPLTRTFAFDDIMEAHAVLEAGHTRGKMALIVDEKRAQEKA